MESKSESNSKRNENFIETNGTCFFCLESEITADGGKSTEISEKFKTSSLTRLSRYLQIKAEVNTPIKNENKNKEWLRIFNENVNIKVKLCLVCEELIKRFSDTFSSLEIIQMEVNYWLDKIHSRMSEALKTPEVLQKYSQQMKANHKTLLIQNISDVDEFRKEIVNKSSKMKTTYEPKVQLLPVAMQLDKLCAPNIKVDHSELHNQKTIKRETEPAAESESVTVTSLRSSNRKTRKSNGNRIRSSNRNKNNVTEQSKDQSKIVHIKNPKTGTFDCIACMKKYSSASHARTHYKSIHLKIKYKCGRCGDKFISHGNVARHMPNCDGKKTNVARQGTKSILNPKTGKYKCTKCNKEFNSHKTAWYHYGTVHSKKIYKCDICNISVFSHKQPLTHHKKTCEGLQKRRKDKKEKRENDPRFNLPCPYCGKKFSRKRILLRHIQGVHLNQLKFPCDLCKKTYKCNVDLQDHKNIIHFGIKFCCKICKKEYQSRNPFLRHEKQCIAN